MNARGQLGIGRIDVEQLKYRDSVPMRIEYFAKNGIKVVKLACGHAFNIALDEKGRVYTWGFNAFGQGGNGHTNDTHTPWLVDTLRDEIVVDIVCGAGYLCVLTVNGECWIWGKNHVYQCCNEKNENLLFPVKINKYLPKNKMIKQICLGHYSTMMILCDE